jgi:hypothetical protein
LSRRGALAVQIPPAPKTRISRTSSGNPVFLAPTARNSEFDYQGSNGREKRAALDIPLFHFLGKTISVYLIEKPQNKEY